MSGANSTRLAPDTMAKKSSEAICRNRSAQFRQSKLALPLTPPPLYTSTFFAGTYI